MPPSQADRLRNVAKFSLKEFSRSGFQLIEKPARQLFSHNARGDLIKRDDTNHNQKFLAEMALEFKHCSQSYNLKQSLKASRDGSSLVYSPGCKLLFAVQFSGESAELVGIAVIVNLKEDVMEERHLNAMEAAEVRLPRNGLFLELICAKPKTGAATYLLLSLLNKLAAQKDAIVCNPTNERARNLFDRHGYEEFVPGRNDLAILDRSTAADSEESYLSMLPGYEQTMKFCTRGGVRDRNRTYWDCGR